MALSPLRRPSPCFGVNYDRMIIVLMIVAVGALLAMPAVAGAHVDKKYRAEYKQTLTSYTKMFYRYEDSYVGMEVSVTSLADQMRPLVGSTDPNDRANLLAMEHQAAITHANLDKLMVGWNKTLNKAFKGFRAKGLRWFDSRAQRARFVDKAVLMQSAFTYLLTVGAFPALSQAALMLSNDPPAFDLEAQKIAEGKDAAGSAEKIFVEALAALRRMT